MSGCKQMRCRLIREAGTTNGKWVTNYCGAPLFSPEDEATGKCKACRNGRSSTTDYPIYPLGELGTIEFDPLGTGEPNARMTWANCPWFRPWLLSKTATPRQMHIASGLGLKAKMNPWFVRKD